MNEAHCLSHDRHLESSIRQEEWNHWKQLSGIFQLKTEVFAVEGEDEVVEHVTAKDGV
jgi:hypothetical protein